MRSLHLLRFFSMIYWLLDYCGNEYLLRLPPTITFLANPSTKLACFLWNFLLSPVDVYREPNIQVSRSVSLRKHRSISRALWIDFKASKNSQILLVLVDRSSEDTQSFEYRLVYPKIAARAPLIEILSVDSTKHSKRWLIRWFNGESMKLSFFSRDFSLLKNLCQHLRSLHYQWPSLHEST